MCSDKFTTASDNIEIIIFKNNQLSNLAKDEN